MACKKETQHSYLFWKDTEVIRVGPGRTFFIEADKIRDVYGPETIRFWQGVNLS